ncbi:hypothetical protein [Shewanella sedimentimangrovi]|uniref:Uncharacterized protein n=1 Tax=Shewanella sedimentimangrovi TaxID=2814293 RepID=A0ABX7R2E9_9GAMM|nr:hypothetical protein [Shewanella sedimentimangrovi]QSX37953.1 hypothetical protein JYB85_03680 [Shewanella sedimentimangrovi]
MDITYKLPHPVRVLSSEKLESEITQRDSFIYEALGDIELEHCSIDYLVSLVLEKAPKFVAYHKAQGMTDHNIGIAAASMLFPYKFRKLEGNILTTSNDVDGLLEQTDIGDDIPIAYLRPPFKNCYIEFTENRSSSLMIYNSDSGEHILEGVYISEVEILPNTPQMNQYQKNSSLSQIIDFEKPFRVVDMMFTGSPLGKSHVLDDALRIQGFYVQDDDKTVNDELKLIVAEYGNDDDFANDINYLELALSHMAKVLLFVNCKQYRDTAFNERKEILKKISSLKSPAKIKKYNNKLRKTYDRLIIKPEDNVVYVHTKNHEHSSGLRPKKAHWRKGHFRMQPYGLGSSKRKVIYIEPTVVGGIFAEKKSYNIRTK